MPAAYVDISARNINDMWIANVTIIPRATLPWHDVTVGLSDLPSIRSDWGKSNDDARPQKNAGSSSTHH